MTCFRGLVRYSVTSDELVRASSKYVWGITLLLIFNKEVQTGWIYFYLGFFLMSIVYFEMIQCEVDRFAIWASKNQDLYQKKFLKKWEAAKRENGEVNEDTNEHLPLRKDVEKYNIHLFVTTLHASIGFYTQFTLHPFVLACLCGAGFVLSLRVYPEPRDSNNYSLWIFCTGYLGFLALVQLMQLFLKMFYKDKIMEGPGLVYKKLSGRVYYFINKVVFLHTPLGHDLPGDSDKILEMLKNWNE